LTYKYTWQQALAAVFCSGVLFFLISVLPIRQYVIDSISQNLKLAVSAGVGLFLGIIALEEAKVIVDHPATLVTLGDLTQPTPVLIMLGFVLIAGLNYRRILWRHLDGHPRRDGHRAAVWARTIQWRRFNAAVDCTDAAAARLFARDRTHIFDRRILDPLCGCVRQCRDIDRRDASHRLDEKRQARANERSADFRQSFAAMFGALIGTSTTTSYIESAAGVSAGGRTGLTAAFVGMFFLLALFFAPLAGMVPAYASAAALLYVACVMARGLAEIGWEDITEYAPAVVCAISMPLTYSIATGIGLGFITYALAKLVSGKPREASPAVIVLALLFAIKFAITG
jgi:AGZA family xanthine/uracil permease-like MFS transporter